jgi:hypothetical protein
MSQGASDSDQWRALVNMVINLRVSQNFGKFSSSCATGGFSRSAQLHGVSCEGMWDAIYFWFQPLFFFYYWWGGTKSTWYCGHFWPIVPAPDDRWGWLWSNWWNEDWQGKPKNSEKTCPSAILSTTNPTWPDPGSNPGPPRWEASD